MATNDRSPLKIFKKRRQALHEIPNPRDIVCRSVVNFSNNTSCSAQITRKWICETFPPPLQDLIISPHVKHPLINLSKKKFVPPCKRF